MAGNSQLSGTKLYLILVRSGEMSTSGAQGPACEATIGQIPPFPPRGTISNCEHSQNFGARTRRTTVVHSLSPILGAVGLVLNLDIGQTKAAPVLGQGGSLVDAKRAAHLPPEGGRGFFLSWFWFQVGVGQVVSLFFNHLGLPPSRPFVRFFSAPVVKTVIFHVSLTNTP